MFKRIFCYITVIFLIVSLCGCKGEAKKEKFTDYSFDYFDTVTTIIGYENDKADFYSVCLEIKELLLEYHSLYTIYNSYKENNLYTVNSSKNIAVSVDDKIIDLLNFSKEMYELTNGKTNVAMGSVLSIWHSFRSSGIKDAENAKLPPMESLIDAAKHTDIENLIIDSENNTVLLKDEEMSIDVGAVAKGYAAERVADYLKDKGIDGYLINIGGNVRAVGNRADGSGWKVGIENPDTESDEAYIKYLQISDMSLVTSGNYQRFYTVNGVNYHHLIDPYTLMPGEKYNSVSVLCEDSGVADALSTALFLMDYDEGLSLINSMSSVEAMWVMPDGTIKTSRDFNKYVVELKE